MHAHTRTGKDAGEAGNLKTICSHERLRNHYGKLDLAFVHPILNAIYLIIHLVNIVACAVKMALNNDNLFHLLSITASPTPAFTHFTRL